MLKKMLCSLFLLSISCGHGRLLVPTPALKSFEPAISAKESLMAGVATDIITPEGDSWLAGFDPWRRAYGVHDNLEVRTLCIKDIAGEIFCFVTADLIGFFYDDARKVEKAIKNPRVHVIVFSSHTHAGPDTIGMWGVPPFVSGRSETYIQKTINRMAKTVHDAIESMKPAVLSFGAIEVPNMSKNRREKEILDRTMSVFFVKEVMSGTTLAVVANFGCHPEVLKRNNHMITADFVWSFRTAVDKRFATTTLFINGALGGMVQPAGSWRRESDFVRVEAYGEKLAKYVWYTSSLAAPVDGDMPFTFAKRSVKIPLQNPLFFFAGLLGFMPERGAVLRGEITTEVNVLRIGHVTLVTFPGELVPELGLEIKKHIGAYGIVGTLANDEIGYILKEEKFYADLFDYERTMSVGPKADPILMEAVKNLLKHTKTP
jgi:hypothetical protein